MSFPTNPTNGQTANINGVVYTYSTALTAWTVTSNFSGNVTVNQINANAVVSAGSLGGTTITGTSVSVSGNVTGGNLIVSSGNVVGNLFSGVTNNGLVINYNTTSGVANIGANSTGGSTSLYFGTSNAGTFTNKVQIDNLGNVWPTANATQDLGSTTLRWRSIYTSDLDLNNGIGDWTIVEGEDDLFLYNNKKSKTYKFALIEVDPVLAPPKINDLKK